MVGQFASGGNDLTQVGGLSLPQQLSGVPQLQGYVDQIVAGIYQAFSLAITDTFWFGLAATIVALAVVTVALKDQPLRQENPVIPADGGAGDDTTEPVVAKAL